MPLLVPSSALHPMLEQTAPAKINLGLHVLRKRDDGYHDIETVFLQIPWADRIAAEKADRLHLSCSTDALPTDQSNLCLRAAHHLARAYGVAQGAALHLEKHLPFGAGLGGGSSDAATTLHLLSELWCLNAPEDHLRELAAEIGSDVPFFLGPPAAYATGRGEQLTPLQDPQTGAPYRFPFVLVVVVPPVHVSTAEAYGRIQPRDGGRPDLSDLVASNSLARWQADLVNDFEVPVFKAYPEIYGAKLLLLEAGAGYASLSGSGGAVYGVFEKEETALEAVHSAQRKGHRVWHGRLEYA